MSELAFPKPQLTGAKRLIKPFHSPFWALSEHHVNRVQLNGQNGEFSLYPRTFDVHTGSDGGRIVVTKLLLDEATEQTVTVNFSRDELDGHITYLRGERVLSHAVNHDELSRDRLVAGPRGFHEVEFNPLSVVSALHATANAAEHVQAGS
jgi:hypothetical protein